MPIRNVLVCIMLLLAITGCDDKGGAKQQKKLSLPKSESTLDSVLKKAEPPAAPARLVADPTGLNFAALPVGEAQARTIELRNGGGTVLALGPLRLAGQSADFQLGGVCRPGLQLAPGGACGLEVTFRPLAEMPSRGEIVVDQGAAGPSLLLPLDGTGAAPIAVPASRESGVARIALTYDRTRQMAALNVTSGEGPGSRRMTDDDYNEAGLPGVVSSFPVDRRRVLTADRYITAVLENTLNSQLPGRAIAVVERPVFGEEGRLVLIPAGSRIIGHYRSQSKYGLARLDISWSRILRPDGGSINLEADSADVMGRAGIPGDLDQRYAEKYGSSLLVSVIGAAGDWALAGNSTVVTSPLGGATTAESGRTIAANRLGNDTDKLAQRIVEDNIDIRPVLTVPLGTRLLIIPSEDIWLRDPDHLQPVTPPKDKAVKGGANPLTAMQGLLPGLAEVLLQSPAVQKAAPQTAQQILQSSLLQQLRSGETP